MVVDSTSTTNKNKSATTAAAAAIADAKYHFDTEKLHQLRTLAPWMQNPKFFQKVALSPSAVMKIMMHCQSGVDKGIAKGGNPVEVMGMLVGRPDAEQQDTLIVTDAFPLPIEGFETRVVADDEQVVNHMIALGEALEKTRHERFSGWYHSHPFDLVADRSHCFLSQTDLSTQLQWQRAEDPHGNPFVAIVVDPLRSMHLQSPQLKAFRAYPPEYSPSHPYECPDGSIMGGEASGGGGTSGGTDAANTNTSSSSSNSSTINTQRLERWGSCWNRYYELQTEYYMSSTSRDILERLTQDYLWMRTLSLHTSPKERTGQLASVAKQWQTASNTSTTGASPNAAAAAMVTTTSTSSSAGAATGATAARGGGEAASRSGEASSSGAAASTSSAYSQVRAEQGFAAMAVGGGGGAKSSKKSSSSTTSLTSGWTDNPRTKELHKAVDQLAKVAVEEVCEETLQRAKQQVFGGGSFHVDSTSTL